MPKEPVLSVPMDSQVRMAETVLMVRKVVPDPLAAMVRMVLPGPSAEMALTVRKVMMVQRAVPDPLAATVLTARMVRTVLPGSLAETVPASSVLPPLRFPEYCQKNPSRCRY